MPISLEFVPAENRWYLVYGMMRRPMKGADRQSIYKEMMEMGVELPDAAIALISLLGGA